MRTFYSEYVQHCMRFYARHANPKFRSDADKKNWFACDSALKGFMDIGKLAEMYNEPIMTLVEEPEESKGNLNWTATW